MDEWIGAADDTVNKTVGKLQRDLIESASLLILASHSERVLKQWAKTLIWLDAGEIKAYGPIDEVYAEYRKVLTQIASEQP